jgi:hypothetical protein
MDMRRLALTASSFALLSLACVGPAADGPVEQSAERIVNGTVDSTHTAVVALVIPSSQGVGACTGTVVQVKSGVGYVLTAAHCCGGEGDGSSPSHVVVGSDYGTAIDAVANGTAVPSNAYPVIAGSVSWDPSYDVNASTPVGDFCMLKFNAPTGQAVIPVATGSDGLAVGTTVEYVGFGVTGSSSSGQSNTKRYHGSAPVDQKVTAQYFQYTEGGTQKIAGPCSGDSGGPALLPAGAAQASQVVVGTTSYGDQSCTQYGVSMRVTAESATSGFIGAYLADTTGGGTTGSCAHAFCAAGAKLTATCDPCVTAVCTKDSYCCATKWDAQCIGELSAACSATCSGSSSSSSSSSSTSSSSSSTSSSSGGTTSCGLTTGDATCDACLDTACCAESTACVNDASCISCLTSSSPPASCNSDTAVTGFAACYQSHCATACGGSSSSSSSSGGTTTSSSSSSSSGATSSSSSSSSSSGAASSSSSGGSAGCGLTVTAPACNACITGSCCAQAAACAGDATCVACLNAPGSALCPTDAAYFAFHTCLAACDASCAGGSSSSSSGATGAGGDGSGVVTNQSGGCNVGGGAGGSGGGLAGLLVCAALAWARRRR